VTAAFPSDGTWVYWRVLGAPPSTEYHKSVWFSLTGDLVRLADHAAYPTAGRVVNRNEIEWVLTP